MKNKKKIVSLALGTLMLSSTISSALVLNDIDGHWAKKSVEKLVEEKVINGYEDKTFKPDNPISRGEASKMISTYFDKLIKSKGAEKTFSDVDSTVWSEEFIKTLAEANIIKGYPDGTFKPGDSIKRSEASKMIYEALENTGKYKDNGKSVSLKDTKGHWAKEVIDKLVAMGVLEGYGNDEFKPENNITRAELAEILFKLSISYDDRSENNEGKDADTDNDEDTVVSKFKTRAIEDTDFVEITGYTGTETNLIIPEYIDGKLVRSIGDRAFRDNKSLQKVTIPDSVTSIDFGAFYDCRSLSEIIIPDSVTSIGAFAFIYCTSLSEITIPDSVTSIKSNTFRSCTSLREINIPNTVTSIEGDAFFGCRSLKEITIPDSVTTIGAQAFKECTDLEEVKIPNLVTSIKLSTFEKCTSLSKITIPDSVTSIDTLAFMDCTALKEVIIPNFVTSIGDYAFHSCSSLEEITIPNSVTSIGEYAFYNCTSLNNATMSNSLTFIGGNAFKSCDLSGTVVVPKSINEITDIEGVSMVLTPDETGLQKIKDNCFDEAVTLAWLVE